MHWSQNLCRFCGQVSEMCQYIHSNEQNSLEIKIKKCLNINLFKDDYKPKQICNGCVVKLNDFSDFLDICYATNQKFESIYFNMQNWHSRNPYEYPLNQKQSVIVSNKQGIDNVDLDLYKNTGMVLENFNVTNCQLNEEILHLVGTADYNQPENIDNYVPEICNNRLQENYPTVLRHAQNNDLVENVPDKIIVKHTVNMERSFGDDKIPTYDCDKINSAHLEVPQCQVDEASAKSPEKIGSKNLISIAEVQKSIQSSIVPYKLKKPFEIVKKEYPCPHCEKIFLRRGTLNAHIAVHTNIRPYHCTDCTKSFAVKSNLTTHKKIHSDQHKCPFCSKKFSTPSKLQRHVRIHTNERPFVCNYTDCFKAFSDKRNLEGHIKTHVTEKNFGCRVCDKKFKTEKRLKQHMKCHSEEVTVYTCNICLKEFKYKNNLVSHIKKHNSVCPYCKEVCKDATVLGEHIKTCSVNR